MATRTKQKPVMLEAEVALLKLWHLCLGFKIRPTRALWVREFRGCPCARFSLPLTLWASQSSRISQCDLLCLHAHLSHIPTALTAGKGQLRWSEWCRKQGKHRLPLVENVSDSALPLSSAGDPPKDFTGSENTAISECFL